MPPRLVHLARRLALPALLLAPCVGRAQASAPPLGPAEPVTVGERRALRTADGATVRLDVRLPASYGRGARRYPVLYVLDPSWNLDHAAATARFLAATSRMPEMLVVGVETDSRGRDFTPTPGGGIADAGGAAAFADRLASSVVPAVDAAYRTAPFRVLVGHSLGGLFAAWSFAERPALFQRAVALDPSLWWDDGAIADLVARRVRARTAPGVLAVAEAAAVEPTRRVAEAASARVRVPRTTVGGESHLSMPLRGLYDALVLAFADYVPGMRRDAELSRADSLAAQYAALSREYGYEVAPPQAAVAELVQRALNRRDGADAVAAAELLVRHYPESDEARRTLERARTAAADLPPIPPPPASTRVGPAADWLVGTWSGLADHEPGQDVRLTARLARDGETLGCTIVAHGVAFDGGDFRQRCAAVVVAGDSVQLWTRNGGGGYMVQLLRRDGDDALAGTQQPRHVPLPPGMTPPDIRVVVRLARSRGDG